MQMLPDFERLLLEELWLAPRLAAAFVVLWAQLRSQRRGPALDHPPCSRIRERPRYYAVVSTLAPAVPAADPLATVTMAGRNSRPWIV
jgi:hypothetical protein